MRLTLTSIVGLQQSPNVIVERSEVIVERFECGNILLEAGLREAESKFLFDSTSPFFVSKDFCLTRKRAISQEDLCFGYQGCYSLVLVDSSFEILTLSFNVS